MQPQTPVYLSSQSQSAPQIPQPRAQQPPYKQSHVRMLLNPYKLTVTGEFAPALLEWGSDGRIRLYQVDVSGTVVSRLLDCWPQDIKEFVVVGSRITLFMRDQTRHILDFGNDSYRQNLMAGGLASAARIASPIGGLAATVAATAVARDTAAQDEALDVGWWANSLNNFGIKSADWSSKTQYRVDIITWIIGGAIAAIFLIVIIIIAITQR